MSERDDDPSKAFDQARGKIAFSESKLQDEARKAYEEFRERQRELERAQKQKLAALQERLKQARTQQPTAQLKLEPPRKSANQDAIRIERQLYFERTRLENLRQMNERARLAKLEELIAPEPSSRAEEITRRIEQAREQEQRPRRDGDEGPDTAPELRPKH